MWHNSKKQAGNFGEMQVTSWLKQQGYQILQCNYACKVGEIDIVAKKDQQLCFVEVKTRLKSYFDLSEVITPTKQRRIVAAAKYYLLCSNYSGKELCRFDVALVEKSTTGFEIRYLPNAFYGSEF